MKRIIQMPTLDEVTQVEAEKSPEKSDIVDQFGRPIVSDNIGHHVLTTAPEGAQKVYLRLHSDPVQEDNYKTQDIGTMARVLSFTRRILPYAAAASILIVPAVVSASPLGNPLDDVSNSSPASSYAAPAGFGNLTGADGDVANPLWVAVTDSGFAHIMNGANSTPVASIDTGISGLTGIALTGYDGSDFLAAVCADTTIYKGKLSQTAWTQSNTIDLTTCGLSHFSGGQRP